MLPTITDDEKILKAKKVQYLLAYEELFFKNESCLDQTTLKLKIIEMKGPKSRSALYF